MGRLNYPNTRVIDDSPQIGSSFRGVEIRSRQTALAGEPLVVSGVFHIPEADACEIVGQLHRALVVVVTREPLFHVSTPLSNIVLFADDEECTTTGRRGWFNFDVFSECGFHTPGHYYITVSLGVNLSNTLHVTVSTS